MNNLLSKNLKFLMLNAGISTKVLSKKTNINRSTIIKILNGTTNNPRIETIYTIANVFNVSPSELYRDKLFPIESNLDLPNSFKDKLYSLMMKDGIKTKKDLSKLSGVPYSVIEDIFLEKTNIPNTETLYKFANFFNISATDLKSI
jgi:transcriptional regulator with XRE-family HTH domain